MEALSQKVTTSTTTTTISEWETPVQIEDNSSVNTEGSYTSTTRTVLPTSEVALGAAAGKNTGDAHLSTILDLRENNVETGFIAIKFTIQILEAQLKPGTHTSEGFTILQWGTSGVNGTLTLSYIPVSATRSRPHSFVLRVTGDSDRICTVMPAHAGVLMNMYLEYNGTDLILACDDSADSYSSTVELAPPTSPNALYFGADVEGMFFGDLSVYNQGLGTTTTSAVTQFPYFLWDSDSSGVIAVIPTPNAPTLSITTPQQLTATSEPFVPYGKSGQLTIDGNPVVSNAAVSSLTRTDWQGTVALSVSPRTNNAIWSDDPSNAVWASRSGFTVSGQTLRETNVSTSHYWGQNVSFISGANTIAVRFRPVGRTRFAIQSNATGSWVYCRFNVSTLSAYYVPNEYTNASITDCGDGTYLAKVTVACNVAGIHTVVLNAINDENLTLYVGDTTKGCDLLRLWVAQGTGIGGSMFATGAAPVTVTDYAVDSAGAVTLGETPSEGAMFTWSGSGLVTAGYFTFIDRGYTVGHIPASFDLSTTDTLSVVKLYINEQSFALSGFTGTTAASLVTWLTAQNSGEFSFLFDGKTEILKFTKVSDTSVSVCHKRGSTLGQLSFAIKFTGASGSDWGKTVAILGKIPQQYCLPHTGKVNEGISILGTNCQVTAPKALKVQRRDDNVRTIGRIIGNVKNRPGGVASYYVCEPTSFFGSSQAPFPKNSLVFGNPNKLASTLDSNSAFTYGLVWERFIQIEPSDITMRKYPVHRSRVGDIIAAFSLDIPMGTILRGLDINFAAMAVGLVGNCASTTKGFGYDWGEGCRKFVFQLNGNSDYSCIFHLFVATNSDATLWRPVPSMGVDAVKVSGANTWKDVSFKAVDYASLVDEDGNSLLQGQRRTHFKIVLANELSSVVYNGLSHTKKKSGKK